MDEEGKKDLKKYYDFMTNLEKFIEGTIKKEEIGSLEILHNGLSKTMKKRFDTSMYDSRFNMFLKEMSLEYIVSGFEGFIGECLEALFVISPSTLKSSKTLTYEEILNYGGMGDLRDAMIADEVHSALRDGIDGIAKYFRNKNIGLDLVQYDDWKDFCEFFYRRNIVVHNNSYPDRTYSIKTGVKEISVRLTIDKTYLDTCIDVFSKYSDRIHNFFATKLADSKA